MPTKKESATPDILQTLQEQWAGKKTFRTTLTTVADDPVEVDILRMNWAERRACFADTPDANEGLVLEIPKRILKAGTQDPLFRFEEGTPKRAILRTFQETIDPAVTKELIDALLAEEHDLQAAKNS